jgi:MoxR-like ATPase
MGKTKSGKREAVAVPLGPLVEEVLGVAYRARRPVLLEGPTGIGKSEIVAQVCRKLGIGRVVLDLSLLEPPDLVGLPVLAGGSTTYAPPAVLPRDGCGILMLEELNRAERYIQQPALQLLTARRLHEYELPEGWSTCAAINPEDDEYQVTPLDPALRARFLNLAVRADRAAWVAWAAHNAVHLAVLRLARQHERFLDGTSPRSWTFASDVLKSLRPAELRNGPLLEAVLGGYVAPAWAQLLVEALRGLETTGGLDVGQLLTAYHQSAELQQQLQRLRADGQTDVLDQVAYHVLEVVDGPALNQAIGNKAFNLEAFERLIVDLPGDVRESLQKALGDNLKAADLLNVRPADVLHGGYAGSAIAQQVAKWAREPGRHHRVQLLVKALGHHLDRHPKLIDLRANRGAMTGLGAFLAQVGSRWSKPLLEVLDKRSIQPIHP